jgi:hypothetical protein
MTIRKFFVLSAVAASIALTACGGGGSNTAVTSADIPATTVNTTAANLAASKAIFGALAGQSVTFPAATGLPANSVITFSAVPASAASNANALAGFTITGGGGTATGLLTAGSCVLTIAATPAPTAPFTVGQVINIQPCTADVNTAGRPLGAATLPVAVNFGGTPATATIAVTLVPNAAGLIEARIGNTVLGTAAVATGSLTGSSTL